MSLLHASDQLKVSGNYHCKALGDLHNDDARFRYKLTTISEPVPNVDAKPLTTRNTSMPPSLSTTTTARSYSDVAAARPSSTSPDDPSAREERQTLLKKEATLKMKGAHSLRRPS